MQKKILLGAALAALTPFVIAARAADPPTPSAETAIAQTPNEHAAEAARYEEEAKNLDQQAVKHRRMASQYRFMMGGGKGSGGAASLANHCRRLAASYERSAEEARKLAQIHRDMAQ